ncbi:MAG: prepilin-type N-terminal cleavage/methylation domain-containing protein [Planctomycetota bacterium]|nr:prepilin-type N-terminal cleavage/methylation domain-containing protein [Planctomycetota bacterium]
MRRTDSGFTLIELMIVVSIIAVIAAIAIPNLRASLAGSREAAAIGSLRTISTAAEQYRIKVGDYPVGLTELSSQFPGLIDEELGQGQRNGYLFAMVPVGDGYGCTADPDQSPEARYFYVDHTGVIRYEPDTTAGPASSPIQ